MSSESRVEVVRLGAIARHENADSLGVVQVHGGYPCIVRLGEWQEGDLAAYVPLDMVVPDVPEYAWLGGHRRIQAKRLRGIFSMGLLVPAPAGAAEGDDVTEALGIVPWEAPPPKAQLANTENEAPPKTLRFPVYTDIEGLRRYGDVLVPGEEVVVTEKLHGANGRYMHDGERLWVGSRTGIKARDARNLWWGVAEQLNLERRLAACPFRAIYGEVYGQVQDLRYGLTGAAFRAFDVLDVVACRYLDDADWRAQVDALGLYRVPELYRGPWDPSMASTLCEGQSTLAEHVREGYVVRPLIERWHPKLGRVILKRHGEGFLTRRGK